MVSKSKKQVFDLSSFLCLDYFKATLHTIIRPYKWSASNSTLLLKSIDKILKYRFTIINLKCRYSSA